jgi:hypothetical protein
MAVRRVALSRSGTVRWRTGPLFPIHFRRRFPSTPSWSVPSRRQIAHSASSQVLVGRCPIRLAEAVLGQPLLTVPRAQQLLGVTYRSANLAVQKLVSAGIVRPLGEARYGRVFIADEVLSVVGEVQA